MENVSDPLTHLSLFKTFLKSFPPSSSAFYEAGNETQGTNSNIKSMLHNGPLPPQPSLQKGRFQQDHWRTEVQEILPYTDVLLTLYCSGGRDEEEGELWVLVWNSHIKKFKILEIYSQARMNCVLGQAQQTYLIPFRGPSPGLRWKEREWKKKEITPIVPKTVLRAHSSGSLHHLHSLSTRHQWGSWGPSSNMAQVIPDSQDWSPKAQPASPSFRPHCFSFTWHCLPQVTTNETKPWITYQEGIACPLWENSLQEGVTSNCCPRLLLALLEPVMLVQRLLITMLCGSQIGLSLLATMETSLSLPNSAQKQLDSFKEHMKYASTREKTGEQRFISKSIPEKGFLNRCQPRRSPHPGIHMPQ